MPAPVVVDGQLYCRECHDQGQRTPNHPGHRLSPYCVEHYKEHRNRARRAWRIKQQQLRREAAEAHSLQSGVSRSSKGSQLVPAETAQNLANELQAVADSLADNLEAIAHAIRGDAGTPKVVRHAVETLTQEALPSVKRIRAQLLEHVSPASDRS